MTASEQDRWAAFTKAESGIIHHALRMVAKYPMVSEDDVRAATDLADEIWDRHAALVAQERP